MSGFPMPDGGAVEPTAPLDIQHDTDPAQDHGPAKHIPHLGHVALLLAIFAVAYVLLGVSLPALLRIHVAESGSHPGVALLIQDLAYVLGLAVSYKVFPLLWGRSFDRGIEWNALAARRHWMRILPLGVCLCVVVATGEHLVLKFFPQPKEVAVEKLMHTFSLAWSITLTAVLLGPLVEEIVFRGFLLPSLAIAYDWLLLERTPAGLQKWQSSTAHSPGALWFGAIFSSVFFALLHAAQVDHAWAVVGLLFLVSLVLSWVRLRWHSVACSTLLHACYNMAIFAYPLIVSGGYRHLDRITN